MKIALDFDGVLAHTMKSWVRICNEMDNGVKHLTVRDIDRWSFFKKWNMSIDDAFVIFDKAWSEWEELESLEQDIYQKTHMLCNLGQTDIVTNVSEKWRSAVLKWLSFYKVEYNKLIFSKEKWKLDYDIYIDDSPSNADKIIRAGKICLLYNQPWNRGVIEKESNIEFDGTTYRIYSLYNAIDMIRDLVKADVLS